MWRNTPPGLPFLWEQDNFFPARWHARGGGPAQYLADTPAGAWAELLRHEEIVDPADVAGLARDLWAVDVPDAESAAVMEADDDVLRGGLDSYPRCQALAAAARAEGATAVTAPSAALERGEAAGWRVDGGLVRDVPADGRVLVLYGRRPELVGHLAVAAGHPPADLLAHVRPLHARRPRRRPKPATQTTAGG
jgi:hypothetical protein